jgi:transglutaminase-like putative cysteine protease
MILQGLVVFIWGLQTDLLLFALPMAIMLEVKVLSNRRWELKKKDFYRIADFTIMAFLGIVIFLFLNARTYHFLTTLIQWLPILLYPLTIVMAYSTTEKITLDVLFHSLRRQKEPVQQSFDPEYLLMGLCLLAIGTNTQDHSLFFPVSALVILGFLFPLRSTRYKTSIWILMVSIILLTSTFTHKGIRQSHLAFKEKSDQWIAEWLAGRTDPLKSMTALGRVGQLKLSDKILFRIKPKEGTEFPALLHEASYDLPGNLRPIEWSVLDRSFETRPHEKDFTWRFSDKSENEQTAKIYLEFKKEHSLVPVPAALTEIHELPALEVKSNRYGAIQGSGLVPDPSFEIKYRAGNTLSLYSPPREIDTHIPKEYEMLMSKVVERGQYPGVDALAFVYDYFSTFKYSLYQVDGKDPADPLSNFLLDRRAGHCEFFASATTLILRQMGIPARYVVGYSVQEFNATLGMYIVRKRHAHTWVIAHVNEKWQVVDTTPSSWYGMERENANPIQPIFDFFANYSFMFQLWWNDQKIEDYEFELYLIGAILVLILIWRITTSKQVIITKEGEVASDYTPPGSDSPFYKIQAYLLGSGLRRNQGEVLKNWLLRIQRPELLPLLRTHNRWRFDPRGVANEEKKTLTKQVDSWLSKQVDLEQTDLKQTDLK